MKKIRTDHAQKVTDGGGPEDIVKSSEKESLDAAKPTRPSPERESSEKRAGKNRCRSRESGTGNFSPEQKECPQALAGN